MKSSGWRWLLVGLLVVAAAAALAPFASSLPDGLETVAEHYGFAHRASSTVQSPMSDYEVAGVRSPRLRTALAVAIGGLTVFLLSAALGRCLARPGNRPTQTPAETPPDA